MDRLEAHEALLNQIHETYIQKNRAYGNSFDQSCDDFGLISALVRMSDKWNRLKTLVMNPDISQGDESIKDTLLDLANYCVMTHLYLDAKEKKDEESTN